MPPTNKKLYDEIKARIHKELERKNTRWGVYASNRLVREYKEAGGTYDGPRPSPMSGTRRWYREKWIDICKSRPPHDLVPCGRRSVRNDKYPVCRPYYRVSPETPTTYDELSPQSIKKACRLKRKDPMTILHY